MASLPYPRRPLNNSPTDGTDQHRWFGCVGFSHGIHGIHRSFWRRIFSHGFHRFHRLGGYGIPAIPTPPSANPPTEFTEFTEISGVEEPPTDFADAHRWLGCVGFCGEIVWWLCGYGRMPYPPNLCPSVQSVGEYLASETSVVSVVSVGR